MSRLEPGRPAPQPGELIRTVHQRLLALPIMADALDALAPVGEEGERPALFLYRERDDETDVRTPSGDPVTYFGVVGQEHHNGGTTGRSAAGARPVTVAVRFKCPREAQHPDVWHGRLQSAVSASLAGWRPRTLRHGLATQSFDQRRHHDTPLYDADDEAWRSLSAFITELAPPRT